MPTFFLAKKYRSGWSKENGENRVIVYQSFLSQNAFIRFSPLLLIVFCYLYIDSYQHYKLF